MRTESVGVTEKLLDSAKKEFLEYGFYDASLRRISKLSGVSTNSIYTRFKDKEGLFDAVVNKAAVGLMSIYKDAVKMTSLDKSLDKMSYAGEVGTLNCLDYIYQHFDEFYLIFCCSKGTSYEDYFDRLAAIEESLYKKLAKKLDLNVDNFFIHVLCRSGWNYIYEAVSHKLTYKQALKFMKQVIAYTSAGLEAMLKNK